MKTNIYFHANEIFGKDIESKIGLFSSSDKQILSEDGNCIIGEKDYTFTYKPIFINENGIFVINEKSSITIELNGVEDYYTFSEWSDRICDEEKEHELLDEELTSFLILEKKFKYNNGLVSNGNNISKNPHDSITDIQFYNNSLSNKANDVIFTINENPNICFYNLNISYQESVGNLYDGNKNTNETNFLDLSNTTYDVKMLAFYPEKDGAINALSIYGAVIETFGPRSMGTFQNDETTWMYVKIWEKINNSYNFLGCSTNRKRDLRDTLNTWKFNNVRYKANSTICFTFSERSEIENYEEDYKLWKKVNISLRRDNLSRLHLVAGEHKKTFNTFVNYPLFSCDAKRNVGWARGVRINGRFLDEGNITGISIRIGPDDFVNSEGMYKNPVFTRNCYTSQASQNQAWKQTDEDFYLVLWKQTDEDLQTSRNMKNNSLFHYYAHSINGVKLIQASGDDFPGRMDLYGDATDNGRCKLYSWKFDNVYWDGLDSSHLCYQIVPERLIKNQNSLNWNAWRNDSGTFFFRGFAEKNNIIPTNYEEKPLPVDISSKTDNVSYVDGVNNASGNAAAEKLIMHADVEIENDKEGTKYPTNPNAWLSVVDSDGLNVCGIPVGKKK